jgi:hypothetical protein
MELTRPKDFVPALVKRLLTRLQSTEQTGRRIDILSRCFLEYPYKVNPLIGSADSPEVFTASLDGFDCVTYIETILALASSFSADGFIERLRQLRYKQGCIQWRQRNHYMTQWIRNNVRAETIRHLPMPRVPQVSWARRLNVVPGLSPRRVQLKCVPKPMFPRLAPYLNTGDLMFFASTRKNLDVFHVGIIIRGGDGLNLRHASRSQGHVVEQKLDEFLKANRMAGVIVARPCEVTAHGREY